jgi:hypothetical protein
MTQPYAAGRADPHRTKAIAAALTDREKEQLNSLLRRLMLEFERREGKRAKNT